MTTQIKLLLFGILLFVTIPLTIVLAVHKPSPNTTQQVLAISISGTPTASNKDRLSCSDCVQQGKDGICFNVDSKSAYCSSSKINTGSMNVLCRSCGMTTSQPSSPSAVTPPPGCYFKPASCTRTCPANNPNCCGDQKSIICPSITPPHLTCYPRPTCLDATPKCTIPEPVGGWCPHTSTPTP